VEWAEAIRRTKEGHKLSEAETLSSSAPPPSRWGKFVSTHTPGHNSSSHSTHAPQRPASPALEIAVSHTPMTVNPPLSPISMVSSVSSPPDAHALEHQGSPSFPDDTPSVPASPINKPLEPLLLSNPPSPHHQSSAPPSPPPRDKTPSPTPLTPPSDIHENKDEHQTAKELYREVKESLHSEINSLQRDFHIHKDKDGSNRGGTGDDSARRRNAAASGRPPRAPQHTSSSTQQIQQPQAKPPKAHPPQQTSPQRQQRRRADDAAQVLSLSDSEPEVDELVEEVDLSDSDLSQEPDDENNSSGHGDHSDDITFVSSDPLRKILPEVRFV